MGQPAGTHLQDSHPGESLRHPPCTSAPQGPPPWAPPSWRKPQGPPHLGWTRAEPLQLIAGMWMPRDPWSNTASLPPAPACIPPCGECPPCLLPPLSPRTSSFPLGPPNLSLPGHQPAADVFQCATCRFTGCRYPLDCPGTGPRQTPAGLSLPPSRVPAGLWGQPSFLRCGHASSMPGRTHTPPHRGQQSNRFYQAWAHPPAPLAVQDVWVREGEAVTLHCDVPFATPGHPLVTWMMAKDVSRTRVCQGVRSRSRAAGQGWVGMESSWAGVGGHSERLGRGGRGGWAGRCAWPGDYHIYTPLCAHACAGSDCCVCSAGASPRGAHVGHEWHSRGDREREGDMTSVCRTRVPLRACLPCRGPGGPGCADVSPCAPAAHTRPVAVRGAAGEREGSSGADPLGTHSRNHRLSPRGPCGALGPQVLLPQRCAQNPMSWGQGAAEQDPRARGPRGGVVHGGVSGVSGEPGAWRGGGVGQVAPLLCG